MILNKLIQIGILGINRESVIIMLNKLPHLPDSRHLKVYVHVATESLSMGQKSHICLGTTKILD